MGTARLLLGLAALAALGGCGPSREDQERSADVYRRELREQVPLIRQMAKILQTVKDRESMTAALERLAKLQPDLERASKRFKRLGQPSPEIEERLQQERAEVRGALEEVLDEMRRITGLPDGNQFLDAVKRVTSLDGP